MLGVGDLGVELDGPHPPGLVGDGGGGVQNIMNTGDTQVKRPQIASVGQNGEAAFKSATVDVCNLQGGLRAAPVRDNAPVHQREKLLDILVVQAQDGRSVEWHLLNEP